VNGTSLAARADHIGSLIRPTYLIEAQRAVLSGKSDPAKLRQLQERAIKDVVSMQEQVSLRSISVMSE
jgi:5-methyltetrahydropteroyltriglutamate--homocysteine methyltransferase